MEMTQFKKMDKLMDMVREGFAEKEFDLENALNNKFANMEIYCMANSVFVFAQEDYTFELPCEVVSNGSEAVIDYGLNSLVEEAYYKEYDCNFLSCLKETGSPFFLVSQKAKDYWNGKFYLSLFLSFGLIALMFFLIENKTNLFIIVGSLLVVSSLPFAKLDWILSFMDQYLMGVFTVFFSQAYFVFLNIFVLGIIVLIIGVVLKFFKMGFKISEIIDKFNKDKNPSKGKVNIRQESTNLKKK